MTDKVCTEAAIWLARIERGLHPHEGAPLREWLQQPSQRDAIVSTAKLYHGADVIAVLAALVPVGFGNPPPPLPRQPRTFAIAVGVGLALFMLLPLIAIRHLPPRIFNPSHGSGGLPRDEHIYATDAREIRTVRLPEGSEAILNGQSRLYMLKAAWVREATVAHGEVLFDVNRSWPRPILILAGGRYLEAPGGRFDLRVSSTPGTVVLTVVDGTVTVKGLPFRRPTTPAEARNFDPRVFADATVGPMQTVLLDKGVLSPHTISEADLRNRLGWEPAQVMYVSP